MTRRACVALLLLGCGASAPGAEASGMDASAAEPGAAPGRDLGGDAMADAGGDAGRDLGVEGPDAGADRCARAGEGATCTLPAYPRRPYRVWVPSGPSDALPVVLALHGGGGSAESTERTTCAGGDLRSPSCLHALGQREGFATVYPNGTENTDEAGRFRVWNAGGSDPYMCVAGRACTENVDDVAYLEAVLDALAAELPVDPARVYATGLSNGGAMAHRLACELAERVVAIAPIGAGNQLATSAPCTPAEPVAVMHVHGTADPCWRYRGGPVGGCIGDP
ncbi:MAG: PHB depolymerase family esterase, partial [Myxococcota bacterium]